MKSANSTRITHEIVPYVEIIDSWLVDTCELSIKARSPIAITAKVVALDAVNARITPTITTIARSSVTEVEVAISELKAYAEKSWIADVSGQTSPKIFKAGDYFRNLDKKNRLETSK